MKSTSALVSSLLSLGYGVSLAAAQSSYSNICSGYHSRNPQANVDGNYKVTYHCESQLSLPDTFHLAGTGVTNVEDCARLCRDDPSGCRGAVWSHKQAECWVSNTDEGGKVIHASGLLYIDPNDHGAALEQCKSEKDQLQAELEKCKAGNGGNGGSGEKCKMSLNLLNRMITNLTIGPYNDLSDVTENGKTFKVYCKRRELEPI